MSTEHHNKLTEAYVKDFYNKGLREMPDNYTEARWFSSVESKFDYEQTLYALRSALGTKTYERALEVGPGDGVWTKLIVDKVKALDLLDQSEEMLARAKETLKSHTDVTYRCANFADAELPSGHYDLIFSVRCFEYITDKDAAVKKLYDALAPGGTLILVTKSPAYVSQKNWKKTLLHTEQIPKRSLIALFKKHAFIVGTVYPAVVRWKSRYALARGVFSLVQKLAVITRGRVYIPWLTPMATESYLYIAHKEKAIVELYGLPGGGKTTLARQLEAKDPALKRLAPHKKGIGLVYFIWKHPGVFFFWLTEMTVSAVREGNWVLFRYRLAILLSTFESYGLGLRMDRGLVVLDEGLYQRICSVYEVKKTPEELMPLMRHMPPVDLLVMVEVGDEPFIRYERYADNPRARRGEAYMEAFKEMVLHNHRSLTEAVAMLKIPHLRVRNADAVGEVYGALKSL